VLELGRPAGEASPATALRRTVLHLLFTRGQGPEGREEEKKYLVLPLSPGAWQIHAPRPACGWTFWPSWRTPPPVPLGPECLLHPMDGAPCLFMHRAVPPPWPAPACKWGRQAVQWNHYNLQSGTGALHLHPCIPRFPPSWTDFSPVRPIRLWTLRDILVKLSVSCCSLVPERPSDQTREVVW